jgi:GntR family transcriptional regulator, transcriptional repressor for pyruvate dehydrogenase complex
MDYYEPVTAKKTSSLVVEQIRRAIVGNELPVGTRLLSEEELTKQFGIARTTLREALRVLESEGLIEIRRGRGGGAVVTMPDIDHLSSSLSALLQMKGTTRKDFDDARTIMECQAARWLAKSHNAADLRILTEVVSEAERTAEAGDHAAFAAAATRLHESLWRLGGNITMATLGALLHGLVSYRYRRAAETADRATMRRATRSYRKLIKLIEAKDASGAEAHWRRHMEFMAVQDGASDSLESDYGE